MKSYGTSVALSARPLRPCQDCDQRLGVCGDVGRKGKLGG
jgi:hypothetical protein